MPLIALLIHACVTQIQTVYTWQSYSYRIIIKKALTPNITSPSKKPEVQEYKITEFFSNKFIELNLLYDAG